MAMFGWFCDLCNKQFSSTEEHYIQRGCPMCESQHIRRTQVGKKYIENTPRCGSCFQIEGSTEWFCNRKDCANYDPRINVTPDFGEEVQKVIDAASVPDSQEWVELCVTFSNYGQGWDMQIWSAPNMAPEGQKLFKLRVPVPAELIPPEVVGEVSSIGEDES